MGHSISSLGCRGKKKENIPASKRKSVNMNNGFYRNKMEIVNVNETFSSDKSKRLTYITIGDAQSLKKKNFYSVNAINVVKVNCTDGEIYIRSRQFDHNFLQDWVQKTRFTGSSDNFDIRNNERSKLEANGITDKTYRRTQRKFIKKLSMFGSNEDNLRIPSKSFLSGEEDILE